MSSANFGSVSESLRDALIDFIGFQGRYRGSERVSWGFRRRFREFQFRGLSKGFMGIIKGFEVVSGVVGGISGVLEEF